MPFDFLKDTNKKVHFIGIGGISMSGLAAILLKNGFKVSGSDMKESEITMRLQEHGANIYIGHSADNVKNSDLVVYTAAVPSDNPELLFARNNNIALMDRAEFLGYIMKGHKYNVAISGTHGKTTSTSMLSHIVLSAELDPTILVGADLDIIGGNFRTGESEYFITEACEYKASFLRFFPYIGVILNIDADHLDFYKDIDDIEATFKKFVSIIPKDGYAIGNADDFRVKRVLETASCNTLTFGLNEGDIIARDIHFNGRGSSFSVFYKGKELYTIHLHVPGSHNVLNALSAVASSIVLGIDAKAVVKGLESFKGAHKRFELKGSKDEITVIDDYAHHPTEIKATLKASKEYPHNKIVCVFQPHTYSRTISLLDEFSESFNDADELILMDIYAAREKDSGIVNSDMLGDKIRANGIKCINVHSHEEALEIAKQKLSAGDLLLTVGAGDVVKVGEMFLQE
ncbi:UDP-N-acetylmuramate--L-alanine ligase [Clostridium cadaveris]|uniref:UDP-N-acetylmuramate--L-alanine ligase n=1 Tax=Clostridium cadaveris TaxID=1529 RepID=A0A1I2NKL6_9CLOT|nr:UDP-N-acetylmuramate--L-alanine ligase [Clostridium cadaveris]MDM8311984.1 UDP-N-acetylmuramate--L-alanine ligase [Clostridium cadaveris]NME62984.1 UDP-N-acetylmuramate--L-alanine ligase [Clostridium cadaveris]SFG02227.1 UDP-N-acetylmuramate--L-alanine ligase [Clostridium cadaveris]